MKTRTMTGIVMAGLLAGSAGTAAAVDEEIKVCAVTDVSVLSAYVWRGQVLNDEAVVQPAVTVTKGGFSINVWGNFNLTDAATGDSREFSEVDLTLSFSRAVGPATLGVGIIEYLFPNQTLVPAEGTGVGYPGTREVYLSASLSCLPVVPSLTVYYDSGEADSFYGLVSLGYGAKLADALSLGLNASLGCGASDYNAFYVGVDDDALNDANLGASLSWSPRPYLTVTPAFQYTMLVDSDIEDAAAGMYKNGDQSIFSLKASVAF